MKLLLILIVLVLAGCNSEQPEASLNEQPEATLDEQPKALSFLEKMDLVNQINSSGEMTDQQAESLSSVDDLILPGLTSVTDQQVESLSKIEMLYLHGLTSITDEQAESLSKVGSLRLNGLTSITDEQAESLSKVKSLLISFDLKALIDKYKNL